MLKTHFRFYAAVILFSLLAAFPVRRTLPAELARASWPSQYVEALGPAEAANNLTLASLNATAVDNATALGEVAWTPSDDAVAHVPRQLMWMYVPAHVPMADGGAHAEEQRPCWAEPAD